MATDSMTIYPLYPLPHQSPPPPRRADITSARVALAEAQSRLSKIRETSGVAVTTHAADALGVGWLLPHFDVQTAPAHRTPGFYIMHEILSKVPGLDRPGCVLLLCEGPGGFVHALLDRDPQCSWHAMTLSSSVVTSTTATTSVALSDDVQPMAPMLLTAKKSNGHARIVFGNDGTGDVTRLPNANRLLDESHAGTAQLVTADGGTSGGARLVAAQVAIALRALRPSGHFVLRLDLPLAVEVEGLVRVAAECFTRCDIVRPVSLSPITAIAYLIGRDYVGAARCTAAVSACWAAAFSPEGSLPTAAPPLLAHAELQIVRAAAIACADAADLATFLAAQGGASAVIDHANKLRAADKQQRRARAWLQ
jgi:hypothetical protein